MSEAFPSRARRPAWAWPRALLWGLGLGLVALVGKTSSAAPPGGYWLSAELEGSAGQQVQAAAEMSGDAERIFEGDAGAALPGQPVARVADVREALAWVAHWAFDGFLGEPEDGASLREAVAPRVGGSLPERFGVELRALVVTGATESDGLRDIAWPVDQAQVLPPDLPWRPAALIPDQAPIFAAPSPTLPRAADRHGLAHRSGGLFILGRVDRCSESEGRRRCLRWLQIVARDGDRFVPGYLPAFQVAAVDDWVRAEGGLPRAQLLSSSIEGELARYLLVVRLADNQLHQVVIERPCEEGHFESIELRVRANEAELRPRGKTPLHIELSPSMDARDASADAPPASDTRKP